MPLSGSQEVLQHPNSKNQADLTTNFTLVAFLKMVEFKVFFVAQYRYSRRGIFVGIEASPLPSQCWFAGFHNRNGKKGIWKVKKM